MKSVSTNNNKGETKNQGVFRKIGVQHLVERLKKTKVEEA